MILEDFEAGKVKTRYKEAATFVYCTNVHELVQRCKNLHNITDPCRIKIGCDSGQDFLKITCQLLNISTNSVHFTLVLAAAPVIETIENLRLLFTMLNIEVLCANKDSLDEIGISVDMKVCPMLYGKTGGNALFPCPICLWYKHDGFTCYPQDPRTMEHFIDMHRSLQQNYNGNRENPSSGIVLKHYHSCTQTHITLLRFLPCIYI